jgi:hypothetical protein
VACDRDVLTPVVIPPAAFRPAVPGGHTTSVNADVRVAITQLFAGQHALASRRQILAAGVDGAEYDLEVRRGRWTEICPGVVVVAGAPPTWQQRPMAATLASPHVEIARATALALHGLDGFPRTDDLQLIAPRGTKPVMPTGAALTTTRRLGPLDRVTVDGIRTTNIATALVHISYDGPTDQLAQALDDALRKGASPGWLTATARRWGGPGVKNGDLLLRMLDDRVHKRLPRSWFERLAQRALAERGIVLEHEHRLKVGRRTLAKLDLADVESQAGVECQSWQWHSTHAAQEHDLQRKRAIRQLGWEINEVWWTDRDRMDVVAADVMLTIERQRIVLGLPPLGRRPEVSEPAGRPLGR